MAKLKKTFWIDDVKQLNALCAAPRQEVLDALSQIGTVSVAELASVLGKPADSLYYHLRVLLKVGLVTRAGHRLSKGRRESLFKTIAPQFGLKYRTGSEGNSPQVNAIIGSMLRLGLRDFKRGFLQQDITVSGRRRELWGLRKTGWLTPAGVEKVNAHIISLIGAVGKTKPNGRLYGVTVLLAPLDSRSSKQ
ncbi:MAG TPA: helix-turn-helix domain-containing protein [Candidatus Acidoferrales bacterium]|nr:helix-turn-helix domain-containing protein [Candidatus Acidoferrales bacterium]